jgi:cellulose synthase/poly-beta-1,6-N-acetylglucosamine synthase-like glycosyltransferase
MRTARSVALIISTFDQPDYLARVLAGMAGQTRAPDELFVADDGSGEETRRVFADWKMGKAFRCEHVWQKHEGFRKARVLNEAIAMAKSDYIVFLDGDTIPHPRFVADHVGMAAPGNFVQGHRALVGQRAAADFGKDGRLRGRLRALCAGQLSGAANVFRWPFAMKSRGTGLRGIRGCNFAVWRADLLHVNGFNEAFTGWGREDAELAARMMNAGVQRMDARGRALCYHLWHPPADRGKLPANDELLAEAVEKSVQRCELGLDRHLPPQPA